ncbi:MAG: dihydrolipoyl dehydrogenase [Candidatus Omnitrophota bacterium]
MYDLIVIGAGWAGYNACMKAKARGLKTALIERSEIGGTCLNRGCIPTKSLIRSAKVFSLAKKSSQFGVFIQNSPQIIFAQAQERKNKTVAQLRSGMEFSLKGIDIISGNARITGPDCVSVSGTDYRTKWILVATGSIPAEIKDLPFDGQTILSSDHLLALPEVPQSLLVVGGGVIGCEFAGLYTALGTKVTLVELLPQLLCGMDADIAQKMEVSFKKKGVRVQTGCDIKTVDLNAFDKVLVCVGRKPAASGLGLEEAGVTFNTNGSCAINDYLATNIPSIYAAGDCTGQFMLAHYAAYQGRKAVDSMLTDISAMRSQPEALVPGCIFTDPEIASVGLTEARAKQQNIEIKIYKADFLGSAMARILDETAGYVKIIADTASGRIAGASIIGPKATELISALTVAIQAGMTVDQLRDTILPHPTLSEMITEALHH